MANVCNIHDDDNVSKNETSVGTTMNYCMTSMH